MSLKHSYTLLAPIYDAIVSAPTEKIRIESLQKLKHLDHQKILINGIGSGLDIPYLPDGHSYIGTDLTPAMLSLAQKRANLHNINIELKQADSMQLPFDENSFDIVLMHLILAVVPDPLKALKEASRVIKPSGKIFILDKFIRPGQIALFKRLINPIIRHIATRTDVQFEELHQHCPELLLKEDKPVMLDGWFRTIELEKINHSK